MMQEEELVIQNRRPDKHNQVENSDFNFQQDILPFTISDGIYDDSEKTYSITLFEIFVTIVVMLSTISGGYLEGYTSPAIPSLLKPDPKPNAYNNYLNNTNSPKIDEQQFQNITVNYSKENDSDRASFEEDSNNNIPGDESLSISTSTIIIITNARTTAAVTMTSPKTNLNEEVKLSSVDFVGNNSTPSPEETSEISETLDVTPVTEEIMQSNTTSTDSAEVLPSPLPLLNVTGVNTANATEHFYITEEEGSWLGSLLLLGAALGSIASPWVIQLGRRHAIIASAVPRFLGWIFIITSSGIHSFYIGSFICGLSIGAVSPAGPIYISEVAHPSLRGILNCIVALGVNVGIFIAALFGTFLAWRGLAIVGIVSVIAYFFPFFWIPNSPSWLALRGEEEKARLSLRKLRKKGYGIEDELQQTITIAEKVSRNQSISWKSLFVERRSALPLFVVVLVTIVNRLSGYNAIITYCSLFIREAVPSVSEYWSNVSICLVQILATFGAMALVDSWGRRKLLLFSVILMGVSLLSIAVCEGIVPIHKGGTWVAVLATMVYVGAYSLGIGPLTWVLMGELFPLDAREKASALVSFLNWLLAFIVTKTYFSLESSVGIIGTCVVYASVCLVGGLTIFLLVPETKGKSLAEIEAFFSYPQKRWFSSIRKFDRDFSNILDQETATIDSYSTFH